MNISYQQAIDAIADSAEDIVEISVQPEAGFRGAYKVYVTVNGITLLRICKVRQLVTDLQHETGYTPTPYNLNQ